MSMKHDFDFHLPTSIRFGIGRIRELGDVAASFGRARVLLLTGSRSLEAAGALEGIQRSLRAAAERIFTLRLKGGEPTAREVDELAALARSEACTLVVGVGGGSVLDAAKALAALAPRNDSVEAYIEGVGDGRVLDAPGLPCVAVPTTAGTGSEATRNTVLTGEREGRRYKRSLRSIHMVPAVALVDPGLTVTMPPAITAASGLDAIAQLVEPYVSRAAHPVADALSAQAIPEAVRALPRACEDGKDLAARSIMSRAALYSGICLSHAGLGVVHGLSSAIGALTPVPHGVVCARLMPEAIRANARALAKAVGEGRPGPDGGARAKNDANVSDPSTQALERLAHVGRWLTGDLSGDPYDDALAGADAMEALVTALRVPRFRDYGITEADVDAIAAAPIGGSMKTNPADLDAAVIARIVRSAL
jgi:alcohol dehydrogenase class IV